MDITPLENQRKAIEAPLGPVLVVAGPGAGKTFCLISRIEYLISNQGIAPDRICVVTFTNKAAEEIAVRLSKVLGDRAETLSGFSLARRSLDARKKPNLFYESAVEFETEQPFEGVRASGVSRWRSSR